MAENGSGAASAGSRSRGAAVRDAYGRFRAKRSFPAADGNGLSWSGGASTELRNLGGKRHVRYWQDNADCGHSLRSGWPEGSMRHLRTLATAIGLAALIQFSTPALADDEMTVERIHSALPLYTFDWEQTWPRSFSSGDEFGCTSRVAFGDWRFTPSPENSVGEQHWERFTNYGVFHCAAIMRTAEEQGELDESQWEYGFFVQLGTARKGSITWELWALQKGVVPGSEYTLLAREPGGATIERFTVLQQRCPFGTRVEVKGLDIWVTRYCAINSRAELLSLSRKMLALPALGVIERVAKAD
jgi:hypothetical protein